MSLVPVYRHKAGKWKDLRSTSRARLCIGLLAGLLGGHAASASPQRVGDGPQPVTSGLAHASATVSDRHATAAFGSGPVFAQAVAAPPLATSASPTTTAPALAPASPTPASGTTPNGQPIPTEQEKSIGGPALPPLTAPPTDVGLRKKWLEQRVDMSGTKMKLFVNNFYLGEVDTPQAQKGDLGLAVTATDGKRTHMAFDNFTVRNLK